MKYLRPFGRSQQLDHPTNSSCVTLSLVVLPYLSTLQRTATLLIKFQS